MRKFLRGKKPYIILTLISMSLSALVLLYGVEQRAASNRKFCQVLAIHLKEPVKKPVNAKPNSPQEREWELKVQRAILSRSLGC